MEEQPATEPSRNRQPRSKSTPRTRPGEAGFEPGSGSASATPAKSTPPAKAVPRSRSAKTAPSVIFQPPAEQAGPPATEQAGPSPSESGDAPRTTPRKRASKTATAGGRTTGKTTGGRTVGKTAATAGATAEPLDSPPLDSAPTKRATRKATPAKPAKPRKTATAEPPATPTDDLTDDRPTTVAPVTARIILAHPGYAPELLATAAVESLGPTAAGWARRTRSTYPAASPEGLARLATQRFVRSASIGGVVSITTAGLLAPLAELATVSWAQAALALHLAAAYGHDPVHPDRAVDLLVLTQVHPDDESARVALAASREAGPEGELPAYRIMEAAWRLAAPLAAQTGGWLALRLAARLLPGAAALAVAAGDAATTQRLAARAVARYRPGRRP